MSSSRCLLGVIRFVMSFALCGRRALKYNPRTVQTVSKHAIGSMSTSTHAMDSRQQSSGEVFSADMRGVLSDVPVFLTFCLLQARIRITDQSLLEPSCQESHIEDSEVIAM